MWFAAIHILIFWCFGLLKEKRKKEKKKKETQNLWTFHWPNNKSAHQMIMKITDVTVLCDVRRTILCLIVGLRLVPNISIFDKNDFKWLWNTDYNVCYVPNIYSVSFSRIDSKAMGSPAPRFSLLSIVTQQSSFCTVSLKVIIPGNWGNPVRTSKVLMTEKNDFST